MICVCFIFSLFCCLCLKDWFNWIDFDLFSFFVFLFVFPLVVVERAMSWLVEQDGARSTFVCVMSSFFVFDFFLLYFLLLLLRGR